MFTQKRIIYNLVFLLIFIFSFLSFSISVFNLFDAQYQHPSFVSDLATWNMNSIHSLYDIPADGRTFILKARINL